MIRFDPIGRGRPTPDRPGRLGRAIRLLALGTAALAALLFACVEPEGGHSTRAMSAAVLAAESEASTAALNPVGTVVLVSLDGTRPADLTEANLPSLVDLGRRGARAEALIPVSPANTFPNHVSLATGVRPEVHGIVDNNFDDPVRGHFDEEAIFDWIESEPIWSIAERAGLPTASFYWVGSEGPWRGGPGPRDTRKFSSRTLEKTKVDQILRWLASDDATRPRLILCWFHGADHAGHEDGPGAPSVHDALVPQDREIARLVRELDARSLFDTTTLLFVSDHGMTGARERINLGTLLRQHGLRAKTFGIGGFATIIAGPTRREPKDLDRIVEVVRDAGLEAWRREEAPRDWHVRNPRYGDIVVRAPIGTAIVTTTSLIDGFHGYAPENPEMAALLVAYGRGVERGASLGRVSNLAVAPTVLRLLGLAVPPQMKAAPIPQLLRGIDGPADPSGAEAPAPSTTSHAPGSRRAEERP